MTKWTVRFVILCGCLLVSASLYAHHSLAGVYALGKEAKVKGAFKAFRLVNPHSSLRIDVKDQDGKVIEWAIVGGSVQQISRLGLGRTSEGPNALHPGDQNMIPATGIQDQELTVTAKWAGVHNPSIARSCDLRSRPRCPRNASFYAAGAVGSAKFAKPGAVYRICK